MTDVLRLLSAPECRLLTLVGPGGIGKTRLALHAAEHTASEYDGVYVVLLQPVESPDLLLSSIGDALGFQFSGSLDPKLQLFNYLGEKSFLLLLDNIEHLLAGAGLLSELLEAAPCVKLLVTSRQRLNLPEEWRYVLEGMDFPAADDGNPIESYESVQLFVGLARRTQPTFDPMQEAGAIARICQLLEGMPLAIELAAAWRRVLPCAEIAAEIARGPDIMESTAQHLEPRHRSMRAMLEQSWRLLSGEEQAVFRRLSVFRGGFMREAAEVVAGATLKTLAALVDHSLLRVDLDGRFDLHELVQQYGAEKLDDAGETDAAKDAHSDYYLNFVASREVDIQGRRQLPALAEIAADFDNVRTAWERALERHNADSISRVLSGLVHFCNYNSFHFQGEEMLIEATAVFKGNSGSRSDLIWARIDVHRRWLSTAGTMRGCDGMERHLETHVRLAKQYNDQELLAFTMVLMGMYTRIVDDIRVSLNIYRQLDQPFYIANALTWMGVLYQEDEGKYELSLTVFQQAMDLNELIGNRIAVVDILSMMAFAYHGVRRYKEAKRSLERSKELARQIGYFRGLGWTLTADSIVAFNMGEFEHAVKVAEEALALAHKMNNGNVIRNASEIMAMIAAVNGDEESSRFYINRIRSIGGMGAFVTRKAELILDTIHEYCAGKLERARQHFRLFAEVYLISKWNCNCPAPHFYIGSMLLAAEGKKERALEVLAATCSTPDILQNWLTNWPALAQLYRELESEFGSTIFKRIWERGKQIDRVDAGYILMDEFGVVSPNTLLQPLIEPLNARELEILRLMAEGCSNREIGERLFLAVNTIKDYASEIYGKLGVNSRTRALARARDLKIIP